MPAKNISHKVYYRSQGQTSIFQIPSSKWAWLDVTSVHTWAYAALCAVVDNIAVVSSLEGLSKQPNVILAWQICKSRHLGVSTCTCTPLKWFSQYSHTLIQVIRESILQTRSKKYYALSNNTCIAGETVLTLVQAYSPSLPKVPN